MVFYPAYINAKNTVDELETATGSVEEHSRQISDCAVVRIVPEDNKVAMLEARIYVSRVSS